MQHIIDELKRRRDDIDEAIRRLEGVGGVVNPAPQPSIQPIWIAPQWHQPTWQPSWTFCHSDHVSSSDVSIDSARANSSGTYTIGVQ